MKAGTRRDYFMTHILEHLDNDKGMSPEEIESNANHLIISGSETCGTVLSGTTNMLVRSHCCLAQSTNEIRSTISNMEEMSFGALADLQYLNAVIREGLRMCSPVPSGLQHVVTTGGGTVCRIWFPEGVSV